MPDNTPRKKSKSDGGAPAYMTTFADLMALLMCFFVLLLSFSELDLQKFKQVSGSLAKAFGVQREIFAQDSPMGTSFVAREFSPGKPDPTVIKTIQQKTTERQLYLEAKKKQQRIQAMADRIRASLEEEVKRGLVDVETEGYKIIIRIQEMGSFASGSAELKELFKPAMAKISRILVDTPGRIVVAGHTDDVPISSGRFRSNWELSSSRAVTVVHELVEYAQIPLERILIVGYGETQPIALNDTPENRALNRRVEIILEQEPNEAS